MTHIIFYIYPLNHIYNLYISITLQLDARLIWQEASMHHPEHSKNIWSKLRSIFTISSDASNTSYESFQLDLILSTHNTPTIHLIKNKYLKYITHHANNFYSTCDAIIISCSNYTLQTIESFESLLASIPLTNTLKHTNHTFSHILKLTVQMIFWSGQITLFHSKKITNYYLTSLDMIHLNKNARQRLLHIIMPASLIIGLYSIKLELLIALLPYVLIGHLLNFCVFSKLNEDVWLEFFKGALYFYALYFVMNAHISLMYYIPLHLLYVLYAALQPELPRAALWNIFYSLLCITTYSHVPLPITGLVLLTLQSLNHLSSDVFCDIFLFTQAGSLILTCLFSNMRDLITDLFHPITQFIAPIAISPSTKTIPPSIQKISPLTLSLSPESIASTTNSSPVATPSSPETILSQADSPEEALFSPTDITFPLTRASSDQSPQPSQRKPPRPARPNLCLDPSHIQPDVSTPKKQQGSCFTFSSASCDRNNNRPDEFTFEGDQTSGDRMFNFAKK